MDYLMLPSDPFLVYIAWRDGSGARISSYVARERGVRYIDSR